MTATYESAGDVPAPSPVERLWKRELHRYPNNATRYTSLGIVVLVTIILYYQQYLAGGVSTEILRDLHISFLYYVNITVFASVAGAIASGIAGLADRYGRANIVTGGVLVTSLLTLIAVPAARSEFAIGAIFIVIGFVEGIILVATPALIRDFSPQLGRASAMGFWTLGPVIGSLLVSAIVTPTFSNARAAKTYGWHYEYYICGIISLVIFAICLIGLRELSPALRDQLMVSEKDRVLIEARAKGFTDADLQEGLKNPFRQMLHLDVIGSAFAIAVFLIIYYIAVGFFPIFFQTVFGYTASQANGIGNWFWGFDAGGLILIGYLSDKLRVRKPLMVFGGIGALVMTLIFMLHVTDKGTLAKYAKGGSNFYGASHVFVIVTLVLVAVFLAFAFAPWMASFTETVEAHNPALTATGLAVWGMIIRVVIAVVVVILPHIVTAVTPVIEAGGVLGNATPIQTTAGTTTVGKVATAVSKNPAAATAGAVVQAKVDKATLAALGANPKDAAAGLTALSELSGLSAAQIVPTLTSLNPPASSNPAVSTAINDLNLAASLPQKLGAVNYAALTAQPPNPALTGALTYLTDNATKIASARADAPGQWRNYFWIAVGGEVVFIPLIFLMAGFWDPRKAKQAEEEHDAMVAVEMAKLESAEA